MIAPLLSVIAGTAGLSAIGTYAWWLFQRVWRLRSDLFAIRDDLWLSMLERGTLDDPAHRAFREGINAVIRVAPHLSIFSFFHLLLDVDELRHLARDEESLIEAEFRRNTPLPVAEARWLMCNRIASYLLTETISGWLVYLLSKPIFIGRSVRTATAYRVEDLLQFDVFDRYNEDLSPARRETAGSL